MRKINLKLTHKLAGLVGLCLLTIMLVAGSFLLVNRDLMTTDRMDKVQNLVESAHSITDVDGYYFTVGSVISEETEASDELATTIDFSFDLIFGIGEVVDIRVGYFYQTWSDMSQFQGSRTGGYGYIYSIFQPPDINGENKDRISWSGPKASVNLKFGK